MEAWELFFEGAGAANAAEIPLQFSLTSIDAHEAKSSLLERLVLPAHLIAADVRQAYMWFELAHLQGDKSEAIYRDLVADRMTPEQITEAQRLVHEWIATVRKGRTLEAEYERPVPIPAGRRPLTCDTEAGGTGGDSNLMGCAILGPSRASVDPPPQTHRINF